MVTASRSRVENAPAESPPPKPKKRRQRLSRLAMEFQPDAVEIERRSVPGGARWTLYIVILLIIAGVAWAYFSKIDRIVIAEGKLVPKSNPIIVQAAEPSPIKQVFVKFGDIVTPGQTLAILDSTFSESEVQKLEQDQLATEAQLTRLQAEREKRETFPLPPAPTSDMLKQQSLFQSRLAAYEANSDEIRFEINRTNASMLKNDGLIELFTDRKKMLEREVARSERLVEKKAMTESELMTRRDNLLESEIRIRELQLQQEELKATKEGLEKKLTAFISDWEKQVLEELVKAEEKLNETQAQLRKARRSVELATLKVPQDLPHREYMVTEAAQRSEESSVLQRGEAAFKLIPRIENDNQLEAEVRIPGKDIGQDFEGDVKIKFNAFPYQKYGFATGKIRRISEASLDERQQQQQGAGSQAEQMRKGGEQATFLARVEFNEDWREQMEFADPPRFYPGMSVTAEIDVGNRRVLDYFLYPLFRNLDRSIREP